MNTPKQNITEFLELVNRYPSPHNGQPIRLKMLNENVFELYFDNQRGLQATDISFIFSFVSQGIFVEYFKVCATALGHSAEVSLLLPKEADLHGSGLTIFGKATMSWNVEQKDESLTMTLLQRQTSRKKYYEGVTDDFTDTVITLPPQNMQLVKLDKQHTRQAIWLNQRAVFDDMFDEPVRKELDHWLRYTQEQKQQLKDGLAYDCMELNGKLMKQIVDHPMLLRAPVLSSIIKQYYLRTMQDNSDVFYMLAPFKTERNAYDVGEATMKIWVEVAKAGYYLHPFGTIMSNHAAHTDFIKLADIKNESREVSYLVFIFRCGKSEKPAPSLRLPIEEHLIIKD